MKIKQKIEIKKKKKNKNKNKNNKNRKIHKTKGYCQYYITSQRMNIPITKIHKRLFLAKVITSKTFRDPASKNNLRRRRYDNI